MVIESPVLQLSHAEVHKPHVDDVLVGQHHVLGLDVAVDDPALVGVLQGAAHLYAYLKDIGVLERPLPVVLTQGLAVDVLAEEQGAVGLSHHLVDRDDVMMAEFGRRLGFAQHPVFYVHAVLHYLDGHRPPHLQVIG